MRFTFSNGFLQATAQAEGGELVSLRDSAGTEYICSGDPAFWPGRNPILFPIVGNLRNGQVDFGEAPYRMSRHGFARDSLFTLTEQGNNHVLLELRETPETLRRYPFRFRLQVRHQLLENGFSTTFTVENAGVIPMPFCIGAHTAIRCPLREGEAFTDYQLVFDQSENAATLLLTPEGLLHHDRTEPILAGSRCLPLDYEVFRRLDTIIFRQLRSQGVSLLHRGTGRGIRLDFHEFPMVAFWTKPGAPFLCMEPWHGCAALENESGHFQEKPFFINLQPRQQKELTYSFYLIEK